MLKQAIAVGLLGVLGAASAGAHEAGWGNRGYAPPPAYDYDARRGAPVYWYAPRALPPARYCVPKSHWKHYRGHHRKPAHYYDARRGYADYGRHDSGRDGGRH